MERRGLVNCYVCEQCRKQFFTINLSCGVTPFTANFCRCTPGKLCTSTMYRIMPRAKVEVCYAWFRPTYDLYRKLPRESQEHILGGGLIQGSIVDVPHNVMMMDPISPETPIAHFLSIVYGFYKPDAETFKDVRDRMGVKE